MRTVSVFHIPAGYPLNGILKLQKKTAGSSEYSDVTNPQDINVGNWYLNWVDDNNKARISLPISWSTLSSESPYVLVSLTGEQTLSVKGSVLHLEVSNDAGISDLVTPPTEYFDFVPNKIPPATMTVQTLD